MIDFSASEISQLIIHSVGNKTNDDICKFSKSSIAPSDEIKSLLLHYFVTPFKSEEYYNLYHETDLSLNEIYSFVSEIFQTPTSFFNQSINIVKHLYERSIHPKIKNGECYIVHFRNCRINNENVDAIGLFKSENKDTFLKVFSSCSNFEIESEKGININKLDKGCVIFNIEKDAGYLVTIVDNINKGVEAKYWTDDFLRVKPRQDEYHDTQKVISLLKNYINKELPNEFEVSKIDQALFLNKGINALKNNASFNIKEFTEEVFSDPNVIQSFEKYKDSYIQERDIILKESFVISEQALKKRAKGKMSTIKLDKNFDIKIHGGEEFIEQGFDQEKKMNFYKLYYKEEN